MRLRKFLALYEHFVLLEATKYDPMFAAIAALDPSYKPNIDQVIAWARQHLQREDRVVWFLRWYRLMYIKILLSWGRESQLVPRLNQLYEKYAAEMTKFTGKPVTLDSDSLRRLQGNLSHYLSLPVASIQQLQFSNQTIEDLIAQLTQLEDQWKQEQAENAQYIQPNQEQGDEILIDFGDGWAWWLLPRGGCSVEAKAMGHCGNLPSQASGDRILSLRKQSPRGWRPSLTFILHANGMLGEMKGRGNDKPVPEYHPYIVKLLENPIVKGISGGGYLPEHNFDMADLSEQERERLFDVKPGLANAAWIYKKFGVTPEFVQKVITEMEQANDRPVTWDESNKLFVVEKFKSVDDLVETYGSDSTKRLLGAFNGDDDMFMNFEYNVSDREARELFGDLPNELQMQVVAYAHAQYQGGMDQDEGIQDEGMDWDARDAWDALVENEDEIVNAIKRAVETGLRFGTEAEAHKSFVSALEAGFQDNDPDLTIIYTQYIDDQGKPHIQFDGPVEMGLTPEQAIQLLENPNVLDDIARNGWVEKEIEASEPHYGFSGYDEAAAKEEAINEISSMVGEYQQQPPTI